MHAGNIIHVPGHGRLWLALRVTKADIRSRRLDTRKPGLYLFGGMWYGTEPTEKSFGKMILARGKVRGTVRKGLSAFTRKKFQ